MKQILTTLLFFGLVITTFAQTPQLIKYQAVVRDNSGLPIANQAVGIKISLLYNDVNGTEIYSETHTKTTNQFGLVNLEIGSGSPSSFSTIDWNDGTYYLKLGIDASGGTNYQTMGTSQLLSVPYALFAEEAAKMDRWFPKSTGTLFSPENNPKKGISFSRHSSDLNIYTISAYDTNAGSVGPEKLMIYGEHIYLNDNLGWNLYNVGIGVPYNETPKEKLHIKGRVYVDDLGGIIMRSSNGSCWNLQVNNTGTMTTTQVSCP